MDHSSVSMLQAQITKTVEQMDRIEDYFRDFKKDFIQKEKKKYDLVIFSDIITDYYTCLETAFVRISKFFENNLEQDRWHKHLLEKMTLEIPGIRKAVIRDETHMVLDEFLRFRHFKRYYYHYDYDREKMEFLERKFIQSLPMVREDFNAFLDFLNKVGAGS